MLSPLIPMACMLCELNTQGNKRAHSCSQKKVSVARKLVALCVLCKMHALVKDAPAAAPRRR